MADEKTNFLEEVQNLEPKEVYNFTYSESELKQVYKATNLTKSVFFGIGLYVVLANIFAAIVEETPSYMLYYWLVLGALFITVSLLVRRKDSKIIKQSMQRVLSSEYTFKVFDGYFTAAVDCAGETKEYKVDFDKITKVISKEKLIIVIFEKRIYIIKKEGLPSNSPLLHLAYIKKMDFDSKKATGTKKIVSTVLFVLTLLSLHGSLFLALIFTGNMTNPQALPWGFAAAMPVPLASIICGLYLKKKGYSNYKKNTIAGMIVLLFLLMLFVMTMLVPFNV
jgi:uncharacterized membrane protein YkoI